MKSPKSKTGQRAYMLDKRLRRTFETPLAYSDVADWSVAPQLDESVMVRIKYSDGTETTNGYSDSVNAYDMHADVRERADRQCAAIRKLRYESKEG